MKLNSFWVLLLFAILGGTLHAQTKDEMKKQIALVKKSKLYLYGEATAETEQDAKDLAEEILNYEINKWAATQKKLQGTTNFVLNNKQEFYTTMSLPRGNMFRSFMYVKKSDIMNGDKATIISNGASSEKMKAKVEEIEESSVMESSGPAITLDEAPAAEIPSLAKELAGITKYTDLATKVMEYKKSGKIKTYNYYAKLDNPTLYYLALYNQDGVVEAVLTPGKPRKNVNTGQEDTTNNYPGCGAIGFMFDE